MPCGISVFVYVCGGEWSMSLKSSYTDTYYSVCELHIEA